MKCTGILKFLLSPKEGKFVFNKVFSKICIIRKELKLFFQFHNIMLIIDRDFRSPLLCDVDDLGNVNDVDFPAAAHTSELFGVHTQR